MGRFQHHCGGDLGALLGKKTINLGVIVGGISWDLGKLLILPQKIDYKHNQANHNSDRMGDRIGEDSYIVLPTFLMEMMILRCLYSNENTLVTVAKNTNPLLTMGLDWGYHKIWMEMHLVDPPNSYCKGLAKGKKADPGPIAMENPSSMELFHGRISYKWGHLLMIPCIRWSHLHKGTIYVKEPSILSSHVHGIINGPMYSNPWQNHL